MASPCDSHAMHNDPVTGNTDTVQKEYEKYLYLPDIADRSQ